MRFFLIVFGLLFSITLTACSGVMRGQVYQIGADTYTVTNRYGREYAFKDANAYCKRMDSYLKVLKERTLADPSGIPDSILDFKCVSLSSQEYKNADYEVEADITIKSDSRIIVE